MGAINVGKNTELARFRPNRLRGIRTESGQRIRGEVVQHVLQGSLGGPRILEGVFAESFDGERESLEACGGVDGVDVVQEGEGAITSVEVGISLGGYPVLIGKDVGGDDSPLFLFGLRIGGVNLLDPNCY